MSFWQALTRALFPPKKRKTAAKVQQRTGTRKPHTAGALQLAPSKTRYIDVVGEADYQDNIASSAKWKTEQGGNLIRAAELRLEPDNPHDPKAVTVAIEGRTVGYLPKAKAAEMHDWMHANGLENAVVYCRCTIIGGWKRNESEGHFGVQLNMVWPPRLA